MSLDPLALLDGPRGRRLCLEIHRAAPDTVEKSDAVHAVFWAGHALAENPGTVMWIGETPREEPKVSVAEAAAALARVPTPELTPALIDRALQVAVDLAAYWQPPYGEDVLAAADDVRAVLAPVAASVAESAHVRWWESTVAQDDQWTVVREGEARGPDTPEAILEDWPRGMAATELQFAAAENADQLSGPWWSTPPMSLPRTTRRRGAAGPVALSLVEDSFGWRSARVQPAAVPSGDVIEIDGPEAWAALCRRHPLIVTASRRAVWRWTTGREGVWVQPDWSAVAREAVGVHLTVAGYLTTAGKVVDLGDLGASVLAGWGPDETFWFDDVTPAGAAEEWITADSGEPGSWRRA
ncbi:hypothetical protein [Microbacterium sp. 1P10AE]|uniref:hypothetical protein n=1 Tax=Microbacterium sp. 1P10AE TaxID=3132286 RepID=UPI00399F7BCD